MNRDTSRPDKLAKHMFFVGLLGLPWLWVVNILYFYDRVYGKKIFCYGGTWSQNNEDGENMGILGLMTNDDDRVNNETDGNLTKEEVEVELKKWVRRSTFGSFISSVLLFSWIFVFQLNKDSFGANWFVYSPADEILTGW